MVKTGGVFMSDRLNPGETLFHNDRRESPNGRFIVVMQPDGNLVLYRHDHEPGDRHIPLWATDTAGTDVNRAVMQLDGNLVLYHVNNTPAWDSGTFGTGIFLAVQDDGNVVLYQPIVPVWATNTAGME
jgi:hypothetical protein